MPEIKDKTSKEWKVWCHLCDVGFSSLEEGQEHDKQKLNDHRRINESKKELANVRTATDRLEKV